MKRIWLCLLPALMVMALMVLTGTAQAEETMTISGKVKSVDLDTRTVVVTKFEGGDVSVTVEDEKTLGKFRDNVIKVLDEVKVKYLIRDGKKISTFFRKIIGC